MKVGGELYTLVLKCLADIHEIDVGKLVEEYDTSYCYAWANDPFYRGAFAIFGPAQFFDSSPLTKEKTEGISLFDSVKLPAANGKLHIGGEATSTHHGWIIGALNSAYRCVHNVIRGLSDRDKLRKDLKDIWDTPDEELDVEDGDIAYEIGCRGTWA